MTSLVLRRPHLRILTVLALFAGVLVAPTMPADADHSPNISISDAEVAEGDSGTTTITFDVTLSSAPGLGEMTTVDYETSDFTAKAGQDYVADTDSVTFVAPQTTRTIDITINGDTLLEENETFFVGLSNASDGRIIDGSGVGTIINDDGPAISIADAQAPEGSGTVSFPVTLDAAASESIDVTYATSGDTAIAGDDYTETTGTLTIAAGATQASIDVPILDDDSDESNETFDIVLSAPTNDATLADAEAVGTILDDDDPATIAIADVAVAEGDGLDQTELVFDVAVTGATDKAISFDFATADGTAESGFLGSGDYTARSGSRTIPAGDTQTTITVQGHRDMTPEAHEEFTVALTNITNAGVTDDVATGVIRNDDATLSITDAAPVQEGGGPAEFDVTIPFPTIGDVSATVDTVDGTGDAGATSLQDYEAIVDGDVVIPEGQTSATVPVTIIDDDREEVDAETFTAQLSAPVNATIDDGTATGTILDDESLPNLVIDDLDFGAEDDSGQSTKSVEVRLVDDAGGPVVSDREVVVAWSTRAGTATADDDYVSGEGTLTIPAGTDTASTPAEIDVVVNGDTTAESDETFFVDLDESPTNAAIADGTGTITIRDDDETLTIEDATVGEGDGTVDVTVRLGRTLDAGETVTVDYASLDRTAVDGADYTSVDGTLTFSAGEQLKTVTVDIIQDGHGEDDETFGIELTNSRGAVIAPDGRVATITILDDEDLRLVVDDASVVEGDSGTSTMNFTVRLIGGTSLDDVDFDYTTADDTATASSLDLVITGDYAPASGTGTIAAGETSTTVTVVVNGDTDAEDFETFTLNISKPSSDLVTIGDGTAVGTIKNDDATISVADVDVAEGDSTDFLVTLSHPVAFDVDVDHAFTPGTAETSDFTGTDGTVTIPAGATAAPLALTATQDEIDEDAETVDLTLTDVVTSDNVTIPDGEGEATGTITDDDAPPTISIDDIVVDEGDSGVVEGVLTLTLSAPTERGDVTVDYATADGTAHAGSDYAADTDTLTIPAGDLSTTVTVVVSGDHLDEVDETFRVELSDPTWATIADGSGLVTILDDDQGTLSVDDAAVDESDAGETAQLDFTVSLSAAAPVDVTFRVDTRDGTAEADSDYTPLIDQVETIPAGETSTTVSVTVLGDDVHETHEAFEVVLSDATDATIDDGVGQGRIRDDDQAPMAPTAVAGSYPATTEGEAILFDGSGSGDPDGEVTAHHWDFGDGTNGTGETVTHSYADDGVYTVTLTVTDDDGDSDTNTTPVTVHNADPTITIDADGSAAPDEQKVMTATVDDPGADELSVAWDLGDGTKATGSSVTHAWASAGTYTVTATVTDGDGGRAQDTVMVTVTAADDGDDPNTPSDTDTDTVTRSAGGDRILTAVQVSRDHWPDGRSTAQGSDAPATDVVLARSDLYPDALAAGPLTAALDAPLLLTYPGELPDVVEGELARLGAGTVWLLGGELAISADVESRLEALGYQVERLSGADRFATAAAVAAEVGPAATNEVVVALGDHDTDDARAWPDALSAGSLSASPDRLPVLLTAQGTVPEATADALASLAPRTVHILGGPVAIRAEVDAQLAGLGHRTNRLAGGTRYTTGIEVAADALARQAQTKVPVVLATGTNFPDGLAAGALAARLGGIVLLVPHDLDAAPEVTAFLADHADRFDHAVVIGGPHVVPEIVRDQVLTAIASD